MRALVCTRSISLIAGGGGASGEGTGSGKKEGRGAGAARTGRGSGDGDSAGCRLSGSVRESDTLGNVTEWERDDDGETSSENGLGGVADMGRKRDGRGGWGAVRERRDGMGWNGMEWDGLETSCTHPTRMERRDG